MNIKDYLGKMQELDDKDTIYSKKPESVTHIIPPKEVVPKQKIKLNLFKEPKLSDEELLFKQSGTAEAKKALWLDYYRRALTSKKVNSIAKAMKQGKFMITSTDEVVILPDMDVSGSSNDLLGKQWLNNKRGD